jgi:hypothetical protein
LVEDDVNLKEAKAVLDDLTIELRKLFRGFRKKQAKERSINERQDSN